MDPAGKCWGLQRTFLTGEFRKMGWQDSRGNVARAAKKTLGSPTSRGAYWPVQCGNLDRHGVVYLAEGKADTKSLFFSFATFSTGLETALGVASASPDLCVYHSAGKGNMARFRHHLSRPRSPAEQSHPMLCLVMDNDGADREPPTALDRATLNKVVAPLHDAGWSVLWISPHAGFKDFDDERRMLGPHAVRAAIPWRALLPRAPDAYEGEPNAWATRDEFRAAAFPDAAEAAATAAATTTTK
ncbi:MAG TPA: hypothetical protein VIY73_21425 [Polyangiaceae bacterium]